MSPDTVRQLHERGYNQIEIARELRLSRRQVYRLLRKAGVPARPRRALSDEQKKRIRYLSEVEGWPPEEISYTLGITYTTVRDHTVPGAGAEWRDTASLLARTHNSLFRELRRGLDRKEAA